VSAIVTPLGSLESLTESTLRELCSAGAVREFVVVGMRQGGFGVRIGYGAGERQIEKVLGTSRGGVRRFGSLDTAGAFVRELGAERFGVDMSNYEPGLVRAPRPDRAEALKKTRTRPKQGSLSL
jgi:hypothetical protein